MWDMGAVILEFFKVLETIEERKLKTEHRNHTREIKMKDGTVITLTIEMGRAKKTTLKIIKPD